MDSTLCFIGCDCFLKDPNVDIIIFPGIHYDGEKAVIFLVCSVIYVGHAICLLHHLKPKIDDSTYYWQFS